MYNIGYNHNYEVVRFTNEIGDYIYSGIATNLNEVYQYKKPNTGFVYMYDKREIPKLDKDKFPGEKDILALEYTEYKRISKLYFKIAIVHYHGLGFMCDEAILRGRKMIFVIHSIPTTEPYLIENPFGGHKNIKESFERMCNRADLLICVSYSEKKKLLRLFPKYKDKVQVVYNGMDFSKNKDEIRKRGVDSRKKFGYIGRLDYRKGILDIVKAMNKIEGEAYLAFGLGDVLYLQNILNYIEGAGSELEDRINLLGWCQGKRKKKFFEEIDVLIVPSYYEPFGFSALEGITRNIPIITSNSGGLGEIVGDYKYQYNPYEKNALLNTILTFRNDSEEEIIREMDYLQRRKLNFTIKKTTENYDLLCDKLLETIK